jgi:hypothetical protein
MKMILVYLRSLYTRMEEFDILTKRHRALFLRELSSRKRRSARFARSYETITDLIGDPLNWPELICAVRVSNGVRRHACAREDFRRLFIAENLKHGERFKLTLFLLSNYTANASLRDESAVRSVKAMLDEYKCLDELKRNSWSTFDLCTGRWEYLNGKPLIKNK